MFEKLLFVFLLSSVKFVFAFPLALKYGLSFYTTFGVTLAGGISGVLFFAFVSEQVINLYKWFINTIVPKYRTIDIFFNKVALNYRKLFPQKPKRIFTNSNKRYVKLRRTYGLAGISALTPLLLSIPIGTFLAIRFYKRNPKTLLYLCSSVVIWAVIFSFLTRFTNLLF